MSRVRWTVGLSLAGLVLTIGVLVLSGCTSSGSNGSSGGGARTGNVTTQSNKVAETTATVAETPSNAPLPADVPAPQGGQLQRAYTTTVGGKTVTVWQYSVPTGAATATTPQSVASNFDQAMTAKGWTKAAGNNGTTPANGTAPATGTATTGASGGAVRVYHHNTTTATVTTRYANGTSGPVMVSIMIATPAA
jgi:hypothetical protein